MRRILREHGVPVLLLAAKPLTIWQTAADTLAVTGSWLPVLLIDLIFAGFWLYLAYAGDSQEARRYKPFAAVTAWVLYGAMVSMGLAAHHEAWAVWVRLAGALALSWDTWGYLSGLGHSVAQGARSWVAEYRRGLLDVTHQRQRLQARGVRRAQLGAARKLQAHLDVMVFEEWRSSLSGGVRQMSGALPANVQTMAGQMSKDDRHKALLSDYVGQSDGQLAALYGVSVRTIRRDLSELGLKNGN